eukprot:815459-Prymnesium_polylepis.1
MPWGQGISSLCPGLSSAGGTLVTTALRTRSHTVTQNSVPRYETALLYTRQYTTHCGPTDTLRLW